MPPENDNQDPTIETGAPLPGRITRQQDAVIDYSDAINART